MLTASKQVFALKAASIPPCFKQRASDKAGILIRHKLACENIRFSTLFAGGDAKRPQRPKARRNGCFRRLATNM